MVIGFHLLNEMQRLPQQSREQDRSQALKVKRPHFHDVHDFRKSATQRLEAWKPKPLAMKLAARQLNDMQRLRRQSLEQASLQGLMRMASHFHDIHDFRKSATPRLEAWKPKLLAMKLVA